MEWKCPRCQTLLSVSSKSMADYIHCPGCQHRYRVRRTPKNRDDQAVTPDAEQPPDPQDSKSLSLKLQAKSRARRRRSWALIYTALMVILSGGALFYLYRTIDFAALSPVPDPSLGSDPNLTNPNAANQLGDEAGQSNPAPGNPPIEPVRPPISHPPYGLISMKQMETVWDTVRPYAARILVHRQGQIQPVAATVLDARGWVLTSRSAIANASRLEIQMAPRSAMTDEDPANPRDDIRGMLAESPELDLVVLQVNRDLINIFRPVGFDLRPLVGDRTLVQVCPPDDQRWPWFQEAQLQQGARFENLPPADQQKLLTAGVPWTLDRVTVTRVAESSAGAALYTPAGDLTGIATGCQLSSGRVVIEVADLEKWMATWSTQVTSAAPLALEKTANPDNTTHPVAPTSEDGQRWDERLKTWRDSQWQVNSATQYASLQELVTDLHRDLKMLSEREQKSSADIDLEILLLQAQNELLDSWQNLDENQRHQRNQWAQSVGQGGYGLLCVKVHIPVIASPEIQNQPTVTLVIDGTEDYLIAKANPEERVLMRSSRWLIWGQVEAGRPLKMMDELGATLEPERFEVLYWIGEIR